MNIEGSITCERCNQTFSDKKEYYGHKNQWGTKQCLICPIKVNSKWGSLDNSKIHIDDFIKKYPTKEEQQKHEIICKYGHKLICVNGKKNIPHFRHLHPGDTEKSGMTFWHSEWQSHFSDTEHLIEKLEGQIKDRSADIFIEKFNTIIEIEHCGKDKEYIETRRKDCEIHGLDIIYIVDGCLCKLQEIIETENNNEIKSYIIEFDCYWKYRSFINIYENILLDISGKIFKIPVNEVSMNCIKVNKYIEKKNIIDFLNNKNPKKIWDLWENNNVKKNKLYIKQLGAGNGKTYGVLKDKIEDLNITTCIILSNAHSEKYVIAKEFKDQYDRKDGHIEINISENITGLPQNDKEKHNQWIITYDNKRNKRKITFILATWCSFYYNIARMDENAFNKFDTPVYNFIKEGGTKINNREGTFKFAGRTVKLNSKTEIWFDEAEDLEIEHIQSITKLILTYKLNIGIVGDALQSLKHKINVLSNYKNFFKSSQYIDIIVTTAMNINRRIKTKGIKTFVNKMVDFEKFELPPISIENEDTMDEEEVVTFVSHNNEEEDVKYICDKIREEAMTNYYVPNSFLITSPLVTNIIELEELYSSINALWQELFEDENYVNNIQDEYFKKNNHVVLKKPVEYVKLHKSEGGETITLNESINKTRIVSTISSRGDGRDVVFCINMDEKSLGRVSNDVPGGIKYESYLHVPITRVKKKLYFRYLDNDDDIHNRLMFNISNKSSIYCIPNIKPIYSITDIISIIETDYYCQDQIKKLFKENKCTYDKFLNHDNIADKHNKQIIDFTDHVSRYHIAKILCHFNLNKRSYLNKTTQKDHCIISYKKILHKKISLAYEPKKYWTMVRSVDYKDITEEYENILIMTYKSKYYKDFIHKIKTGMQNALTKIQYNDFSDISSMQLELNDFLYISHILLLFRYKSNNTHFTINELYSIIDRDEDIEINNFYNKIKPISDTLDRMFDFIEKKYKNIIWCIEKSLRFIDNNNKNKEFFIKKKETVVTGYNDEYVIDIVLKPNFNRITFFDIAVECLFNRFIIYNTSNYHEDSMNKEKYSNKKIKTIILAIETNEIKIFDWDWDTLEQTQDIIKNIIKKSYMKHYTQFNERFYIYIKKIKDNWKKDDYFKVHKKNYNKNYMKYIEDKIKFKEKQNTKLKYPKYVKEFITTMKTDLPRTKTLIKNKNEFLNEMSRRLENDINSYMGFEENSESESESESDSESDNNSDDNTI